jgi:hypothetical protein
MENNVIIMDVKHCPHCYHWWNPIFDWILRRKPDNTPLSQKAFKVAEIEPPSNIFPAFETKITPLQQPVMAAITIKALITHMDICLKCGRPYYSRAMITKMPIQFQQPQIRR